ncbi:hypothetical protein GCM10020331_005770 [Ectobacillus funiculus]
MILQLVHKLLFILFNSHLRNWKKIRFGIVVFFGSGAKDLGSLDILILLTITLKGMCIRMKKSQQNLSGNIIHQRVNYNPK